MRETITRKELVKETVEWIEFNARYSKEYTKESKREVERKSKFYLELLFLIKMISNENYRRLLNYTSKLFR